MNIGNSSSTWIKNRGYLILTQTPVMVELGGVRQIALSCGWTNFGKYEITFYDIITASGFKVSREFFQRVGHQTFPKLRTLLLFVLSFFRHLICVLALMWTGLVNGQPFFFPDTSNYVRAADAAVYIASGHALRTEWTTRYEKGLATTAGASAAPATLPAHTSNNVRAGLIMGGRSPFIGALMYLGWVTAHFWTFVLMQAIIAYTLIILTLKRFRVGTARNITVVTLILAFLTSLPTYDSLLLADAFAAFGILAFILLVDRQRRSKGVTFFLMTVLSISIVSHMTHLMMVIDMVLMLGLVALIKRKPLKRRVWTVGIASILIGVGALQATSMATRIAFHRPPQLLPLLTARFYMDGPGKRFIDEDCHGRFEICRIKIGHPANNAVWLFSDAPETGAYMLGDVEQRRLMGEQDVAFALAVLQTYPLQQISRSALNVLRQVAWIDYSGLNQGCFERPGCWENLPQSVRRTLRNTPSGRNAWPESAMNLTLYITVLSSLFILLVGLHRLRKVDVYFAAIVSDWLLIGGSAMLVCCAFGGAVADPQYRYQGRLVWLIVLMAAVVVLRLLAHRNSNRGRVIRSNSGLRTFSAG